MPADLTVSIINHSNPQMLRDCLRSLFTATHRITLDVWIVDNATDQMGVPEMHAEFPQVQWLRNSERLGFSANHNQTLRRASGRYVCLLNDDTLIHDGALDALVAYMDANPKVGIAGAKILNADGTLQDCTFRFLSLWLEIIGICCLPGPLRCLKRVSVDPAQLQDQPAQVDWVLGACLLVRAAALRQIGQLDARMSPIAYTEEVDWCYRARQAGWGVGYCPKAVITHLACQSTKPPGSGPDPFYVEMHRTRIAFFHKHHGPWRTLLLRAIYVTTLPWNALMLGQSILRKTGPASQCRNALATLTAIAGVSLKWKP